MTAGFDDAVNRARVTCILVQLIFLIFFSPINPGSLGLPISPSAGKRSVRLFATECTSLNPIIDFFSVVS